MTEMTKDYKTSEVPGSTGINRAEFLSQENSETLSGSDLYQVLLTVASESSDQSSFVNNLNSTLTARLGSTVEFVISFNGDFWYPSSFNLPRCQLWSGQAGVLPGFDQAVGVFVWW